MFFTNSVISIATSTELLSSAQLSSAQHEIGSRSPEVTEKATTAASTTATMMGSGGRLKWVGRLDMYRKIPADLMEGTRRGSILSVFAAVVMLCLFLLETGAFFQKTYVLCCVMLCCVVFLLLVQTLLRASNTHITTKTIVHRPLYHRTYRATTESSQIFSWMPTMSPAFVSILTLP